MFQRILVPLDGSPRAERALPVAARLAQASGGTVVLLQVVGPPTAFAPTPAPNPGTLRAIVDADLAWAKTSLEALTKRSCLSGVPTETEAIEGQAASTILWEIEAQHIDLIVLCSHGYSGFKRWVLGSIAEKVARYTPVPVLLLREGGPTLFGTPPRAEGPLRALVPLDGSDRAQETLLPAAQLVAAFNFAFHHIFTYRRVAHPGGREHE
jgi:nucleotide-binding universal stress UspA family protein